MKRSSLVTALWIFKSLNTGTVAQHCPLPIRDAHYSISATRVSNVMNLLFTQYKRHSSMKIHYIENNTLFVWVSWLDKSQQVCCLCCKTKTRNLWQENPSKTSAAQMLSNRLFPQQVLVFWRGKGSEEIWTRNCMLVLSASLASAVWFASPG